MKSIIACILALFLAHQPVVSSNPVCEYVQCADLEQWEEVCEYTIKNENFISRIDWHFGAEYTLDECLYTEVLPYNTTIIWHFTKPYMETDTVVIALVNQDYLLTNVIEGTVLPNGSVLFDFSEVLGGTYYFFEFSSTSETRSINWIAVDS